MLGTSFDLSAQLLADWQKEKVLVSFLKLVRALSVCGSDGGRQYKEVNNRSNQHQTLCQLTEL